MMAEIKRGQERGREPVQGRLAAGPGEAPGLGTGRAVGERARRVQYPLYDAEGKRTDNTATIDLTVSGVENPADENRMTFTVEWKVVVNGATISASSYVADIDTESEETVRHEQILFEDAKLYWF